MTQHLIETTTTFELDPDGLSSDHPYTMQTATGRVIDPLKMTADDVEPRDIAIALGNICRYGGHCRFMSVAEHSVNAYKWVRDHHPEVGLAGLLAALFHDAHEAYLGDIVTPLKRRPDYDFMAEWAFNVDRAIATRIGIDPAWFDHPVVKAADRAVTLEELQHRAGNWAPATAGLWFANTWQLLASQ